MINPIDKDKVAEMPNILAYPHHIGSIVIKPEDEGKIKSRALAAMREQTKRQLTQIQKQLELLANQANELKQRMIISEQIYLAELSFEPFVGNIYHLYNKSDKVCLMLVGPDEWGRSKPSQLKFLGSVKLLSDHTWELIKDETEDEN